MPWGFPLATHSPRRTRGILECATGRSVVWLNKPAKAILERQRQHAEGRFARSLSFGATCLCGCSTTPGARSARSHVWSGCASTTSATASPRSRSNGINLRIIGQLLGHKEIESTLGYAHIATEALTRSASRVSG